MSHVQVPSWVLLGLILIALCAGVYIAVILSGNSNLRDDVERLQTGIRAAGESQQILVGQLGELSINNHRIKAELESAILELDHSREQVGDLERQIEDSRNASVLIGESVASIGEFINEVDRLNSERED